MEIRETTKRLYWSHYRRFLRWLTENQKDRNDPKNWSDALDKLTKGCTKKTWRLYRNATFWGTKQMFGDVFANRYYMETELLKKPTKKTKKLLKRLDFNVLKNILSELTRRNTEPSKRLADIIITMVATGIRPAELSTAKLEKSDHKYVLVVVNAKYREAEGNIPARANGLTRSLIIDGEEKDIIGSIKNALKYCHGRNWSSMAANINRRFRQVMKKLITEKKVTKRWQKLRLYDCRHQFSANAKAILNTAAGEVAAAMGHRSVETAVTHYGRRKYANAGGLIVRPSSSSIAAVDNLTIGKFNDTLERNQKRKNAKMGNTNAKSNDLSQSVKPKQ